MFGKGCLEESEEVENKDWNENEFNVKMLQT